ncbi:MAG: type II toxin-antitoxin system VapC family toxin [Microthrixaceae bacterium]
MIVVDTSAIVAVMFAEPGSGAIANRLLDEPCVMSTANRVELGIVIEAKSGPAGTQLLEELLNRIDLDVVPVTTEVAEEALVGWRRFGKGRHRAGLNLGDTFSYGLAMRLGAPLLFVGEDFTRTDVALP